MAADHDGLRSTIATTAPVDHGTAGAFTREVIPVIGRHGGEYDGWAAMLEE